MATGKPLEIIVDESLYDLVEVNALVEQGHTIKKLVSHGYDLILGPKASNLTVADIKANPKLLEIALLKGKELKYPKQVAPPSKKGKVKKDVVEDTPTHDGEAAEALPAAPVKRKRGPRKAKPVVEGSPISEGSGGAVDPGTVSDGDSTSDGGE